MKKLSFVFALLGMALGSLGQVKTGTDIAVTSTDLGKVRGFVKNNIYTYKGIPYAEAKRFEAPQKPKAWEGIRSSMTYGPVAPLMNPVTSVNDESEYVFQHDWGYPNENCLVLNVWTPGINDGKKRPVMFWIHGGGFAAGSSQELASYDGENLAKKGDVVVVSINHRLNVLGFLDLSAYGDKYKTSANSSVLDMISALEWVKTNITNFGGDPNNVTIFGQSGGGAKVNTLMIAPAAQGLFSKAINQSGAFRNGMLTQDVTRQVGAEVLKNLNLSANDIDKIQDVPFKELSEASTKALKTVGDKLKAEGRQLGNFGLGWGPSVDGNVLPYQFTDAAAKELYKNIPLMIGTVKNEFMASLGAGLSNGTPEQINEFIKKRYADKADAYVAAVKQAYPNDTRPSDLIDVDLMFRPGAVNQANIQSAISGGAPVYMYLFTWQSPVLDGKYKAIHCIELPFVFNNSARCYGMTGGTQEADALAQKVSQAWINFARNGNPNQVGLPDWQPYTEANGTTMFFDNKCSIRHHHDAELLKLMQQ